MTRRAVSHGMVEGDPHYPPATDYPWIRKWGKHLRSGQYDINMQVQKARDTNAPENAIYHRDGYGWYTTDDITNEATRSQLGLPPVPPARVIP